MAKYGRSKLSISGLKEIKSTLALMAGEIDGPQLYAVMGAAVKPIQKQAKANVFFLSVRVGMSVNVADKQPPSRPSQKTVKVVVHKADTIRDWVAAQNNRSGKAKVPAGGHVAESLASMLEEGTSRTWRNGPGVEAHHWFSNAVGSSKSEVKQLMIDGLNGLIAEVLAKRQIPQAA